MKSYGRAKYSNNPNSVVQTAINFDKLLCENTNRPTAAKSSGTVGKWGVTSFTSIRSNNFVTGNTRIIFQLITLKNENIAFFVGKAEETSGSRFSVGKKRQHQEPTPAPKIAVPEPTVNVIRPKKFFKSRNVDSNRSERKYSVLETKKTRTVVQKTPESSPEKEDRIPEANELSFASLTPTKDPSKPPIVLRIFKGKSQLVNEPNSTQKPLQAIEVPESNDQITPTITTRSLRRRNPQTTYIEPEPEETEESLPIIDIPKKRRQDRAKFIVPALKINISKNTIINQNDNELKKDINEKEVINTNIEKSKISQVENERNQLAVLEGIGDSLSSPKMDCSGDREEEKSDDNDDSLKQLETQFKSDEEPVIKKMEEKKEPVQIQSEIRPLKVRGIFIETEPLKPDVDLTEKMEVEQSEAIIPAKKSIFKSRNERNKKGMYLYKHSWAAKDKKVDEEKKEESIPSTSPSNDFEEKPLQRITKTTDIFDDDFDSVTSVKCNRKEKGVSRLIFKCIT